VNANLVDSCNHDVSQVEGIFHKKHNHHGHHHHHHHEQQPASTETETHVAVVSVSEESESSAGSQDLGHTTIEDISSQKSTSTQLTSRSSWGTVQLGYRQHYCSSAEPRLWLPEIPNDSYAAVISAEYNLLRMIFSFDRALVYVIVVINQLDGILNPVVQLEMIVMEVRKCEVKRIQIIKQKQRKMRNKRNHNEP